MENEDFTITGEEEFTGNIDGDIQIESSGYLKLTGNCAGDILIKDGALLEMTGLCEGDVTVFGGGNFRLRGTLEGDLFNAGTAEVVGLLQGDTVTRAGGFTTVDSRKVEH